MKEVTMTGLTNEQVQQRIEEGKVNANENPNTRSYKQIVRENVLTFFNFLNLALMVMVLLVGSYKNSMFMGIIVINTVIGIIQEVRAKKTLDKLAILTERLWYCVKGRSGPSPQKSWYWMTSCF